MMSSKKISVISPETEKKLYNFLFYDNFIHANIPQTNCMLIEDLQCRTKVRFELD